MVFWPRKPFSTSCLFLGLGLGFLLFCEPVRAAGETLNQAKIHGDYNNGDFDKVEQELEAFKSRHKTYSREDSVFIAKHLAVVYAASQETREKGRYYMFQLLDLLPSARIVDMFVSEEIDRIFDKVKEEFREKQLAMGKSPAKEPEPSEANPPHETPPSGHPTGSRPAGPDHASGAKYWVVGGIGLAAVAGVGAYFLMANSPKAEDKIYVVQKP